MANFTEFINELHDRTGLNVDVISAWVSREQGVNNNVLGITSGRKLLTFPSQKAAADATANLLQRSSNYSGIIASVGGTSQQQALAIAQSPWRLGGTGLKNVGGTDPYYLAGFVKAGILSNSSTPSGGASTPLTLSPNQLAIKKAIQDTSNATAEGYGNPLKTLTGINIDLSGPILFIGVILVGITLIATGGLISLKGKT